MNNAEARQLLAQVLEPLRVWSYGELCALINKRSEPTELVGLSGVRYQLEVEAVWDGDEGGPVRVMAAIDDASWRAFLPLTDDFIMAPDGSFMGEQKAE